MHQPPRVRARKQFRARKTVKVAKMHATKRMSRFITPNFLLICMSITLGGICIGILFFSSFFVVSDIVVARDKVFVEPQKIEQAMRPVIGKNIFMVDAGQIHDELVQMFPTIQKVEVNKLFPRTIQVRVYSWPMVAQVNYKGESGTGYLLSENGYVVPNVLVTEMTEQENQEQRELISLQIPRYGTVDPEHVPLLTLSKLEPGKHFMDKSILDRVRLTIGLYEKNFQVPVTHVEYLPFEREVHLYVGDGTALLIWLTADIETQLFKLKTAESKLDLESGSLAYIDLRVKDKVFTCAAGATCAAKLQ